MCQSEELKCDSKFQKVHLLWVQRPCEVEDVWASRATDSIRTSCSSLMSANRSFGHAEEPLWLLLQSRLLLCLGLENAQHFVSAISCVLLYMQDISAVTVQRVCAPMQHPVLCIGRGSDGVWVLGVLCYWAWVICTGCATEAVILLEKSKSRRNIRIFIGFPTPR